MQSENPQPAKQRLDNEADPTRRPAAPPGGPLAPQARPAGSAQGDGSARRPGGSPNKAVPGPATPPAGSWTSVPEGWRLAGSAAGAPTNPLNNPPARPAAPLAGRPAVSAPTNPAGAAANPLANPPARPAAPLAGGPGYTTDSGPVGPRAGGPTDPRVWAPAGPQTSRPGPQQAWRPNSPLGTNPANPLGAARPANPLGAARPANPLGAARPANPLGAARPANPLGAGGLGSPLAVGAVGTDSLRPIAEPLGARPGGSAVQRVPARTASIYRGLPQPIRVAGWLVLAVAVGAVLGATAPTAIERIGAVAATQPGLLAWYSVRAMGFLAYFVLAGSVLYGLLLSTKILDAIAHRPVSFALHKDLAVVALILGCLHGALLVFDQSFDFTPRAILVPFASPYSPVSVGIGQLTLYAVAVVTASFYVRRQIGQRAWRLIHYITFLAFAGASAHGIFSGSDSGSPWAFWAYLVPVTASVFLMTYRIVLSASDRAERSQSKRAGIPSSLPAPRGPFDRPGAKSGGF